MFVPKNIIDVCCHGYLECFPAKTIHRHWTNMEYALFSEIFLRAKLTYITKTCQDSNKGIYSNLFNHRDGRI